MDANQEHRIDPNQASQFLIELTHFQSVDHLLNAVIDAILRSPDVSTAQIWLIDEGDRCPQCPWNKQCTDHSHCLRMVAGRSSNPNIEQNFPEISDTRARLPLGMGILGRTLQTGASDLLIQLDRISDSDKIGVEWTGEAQMSQMLIASIFFKGELLGAFLVFTRAQFTNANKPWGRVFCGYVGAALANARAFDKIRRLTAQLELQNAYLHEVVVEAKAFGKLVGQSAALQRTVSQLELVAPTEASVLILGETGTGKELVAYEVHNRSLRKNGPLVRVNCASIPRELFESEFFGHVKGAFTGAFKDRAGRFETAEGGTLFLDEIAEIPMEMQGKLLRVLQEHCYERVGDDHPHTANVRIIAATNRDLKQAVTEGKFREDLYYRINVFPIEVAPLRERKDDIPLLVRHFIELSVKELRCPQPRLTRASLTTLMNYDWPGNIRELRNVVERAVILASGKNLRFDVPVTSAPNNVKTTAASSHNSPDDYLTESELIAFERENLRKALQKANWKIKGPQGAAELLGLKPTTLLSRIKKMQIRREPR